MQEGSYANKKTSLTLPSNGTTALQSREERISKIEALFFIPGEESAPLSFLGTIAFTAAARERERSRGANCRQRPRVSSSTKSATKELELACASEEEEELPPRNRSIVPQSPRATRERESLLRSAAARSTSTALTISTIKHRNENCSVAKACFSCKVDVQIYLEKEMKNHSIPK